MGAAQSTSTDEVSDAVKSYQRLVEDLMGDQTGFMPAMKDIASVERSWLEDFTKKTAEAGRTDPIAAPELYGALESFVRQSADETAALLADIPDRGLRSNAQRVIEQTNRAVVMARFYETKYLQLSHVFLRFVDFVPRLLAAMGAAGTQAAAQSAAASKRNVAELLNTLATNTSVTSSEEGRRAQQSAQNVQSAITKNLAEASRKIQSITNVSINAAKDFPQNAQKPEFEPQPTLPPTTKAKGKLPPGQGKDPEALPPPPPPPGMQGGGGCGCGSSGLSMTGGRMQFHIGGGERDLRPTLELMDKILS